MKSKSVYSGLLVALMIFSGFANAGQAAVFPYGLLELRGYAMEISKDGKFSIHSDTTTFVKGNFSVTGNKITVFDHGGQYACRGQGMNPGSYYWTVHDQGLYLMLIKDSCVARKTAFLEAPLKIKTDP